MNFMKYTWLWFLISGILIVPGLIALMTWGLQFGIDFRGGTLMEIQPSGGVTRAQIEQVFANQAITTSAIQDGGQGSFIIRFEPVDQAKITELRGALKQTVGDYTEDRFETVGPTISRDLTQKAILAIILAVIAIILYIAAAFSGLPRPASSWKFGFSAVLALIHDLIFTIGAFSILGHFFSYEVDALFITALLTVMGFSVHDTIVVFDRIRENLKRSPSRSFADTANLSLGQTLARSLATSLTVIFVLLALFLLGGETTKPFVAALLLGVTIGTYSSIFNATPLVALWHRTRS